MNDRNGKGYYSGEDSESILGYIHWIMFNGLKLGDAEFRFLSYSNSQLKNHACWFLCSEDAFSHVSEASIERSMGDFSKETNVLKRYARKGQCFSSSHHICDM